MNTVSTERLYRTQFDSGFKEAARKTVMVETKIKQAF